MPEATACAPSVVADTIMRTIELGVMITDAAVDEDQTTIFCAPVARDARCPDCGRDGRYRDTVTRPLADLPVAGYPLVLRVAVPRYRCYHHRLWSHSVQSGPRKTGGAAGFDDPTVCPVCVAAVIDRPHHHLGHRRRVGRVLAHREHDRDAHDRRPGGRGQADRLAGVRVIGVDEHRWAPRRVGAEGFVTLIIDLTPVHDRSGPARLLDMVTGRSATALATWLAAQPADFAAGVEVVAMDGFAGYKTAATNVVPDAVTVMDPFHVVALAGAKLDLIRQRVQQQTLARRGHTGDPLYGIRRIARTRIQLLSARQYNRLTSVLDADEHIAVKVAYVIYQKIIAAYADSNRRRGKHVMTRLIDSIRRGVPVGLEEIAQLGRTLWRRRGDILAFFDHHVSNGPTEAINGRLEALRRNALGFRNITHYRIRSLLHSGALHALVNAL